MRFFKKIAKFVELCAWFDRKLQHYILGNWACYISSWDYENGCWNKRYFDYLKGYPLAWFKFMWLSRREILGAGNQ